MATVTSELQPTEEYKDKGLKGGALGLIASVTMGVASTAPAYSLAATLTFVVVLVGFHDEYSDSANIPMDIQSTLGASYGEGHFGILEHLGEMLDALTEPDTADSASTMR